MKLNRRLLLGAGLASLFSPLLKWLPAAKAAPLPEVYWWAFRCEGRPNKLWVHRYIKIDGVWRNDLLIHTQRGVESFTFDDNRPTLPTDPPDFNLLPDFQNEVVYHGRDDCPIDIYREYPSYGEGRE